MTHATRSPSTRREGATDWRTFLTIWTGQTVSSIGTTGTYFGLGVWTYQRTASTSALSVVLLASIFPQMAILPIAGSVIDRYDRRVVMMVADSAAAGATIVLISLHASNQLTIPRLGTVVAIGSLFQGIQTPAFTALSTSLIGRSGRGRAAGLTQVSRAVPNVLGPVIAGTVLSLVGLTGVFVVDLVTFAIAVGTLALTHTPPLVRSAVGQLGVGSLRSEAVASVRYLMKRRGLVQLLALVATLNVALAFLNIYLFPILLSIGSAASAGVVAGLGAAGMITGAMVMSIWGGPPKRLPLILTSAGTIAGGVVLFGVARSRLVIGVALFVVYFALALVNSSTQPIWQNKVEHDLQGRVFSFRRLIAISTMPLAYAISGPLADRMLTPLVANGSDGVLAAIVGTGGGRGAAAGAVLAGATTLLIVAVLASRKTLRNVEADLPDVA